jgi:hypothetical protein
MKNEILNHLFSHHDLDSGSLTMLGPIVHQFNEPGAYRGDVFWNEQQVGRFMLCVQQGCPASQVDIDLSKLPADGDCGCGGAPGAGFAVRPQGYAVFHVTRALGGYAVTISSTGEKPVRVFDSRKLAPGDIFAASMLRPGRYALTNTISKARGEIVVAYPQPGGRPAGQLDPINIECLDKEFRPAQVRLESAQGTVYRMRAPGRIVITLVEPDDGPQAGNRPTYAAFGTRPKESAPPTKPRPRKTPGK